MPLRPSPPTQDLPDVPVRPCAPTTPVGRGWITAFALACTGMWLAVLTPAQVQLARHAAVVDPAGKELLLGTATGTGAAVTMIAVPLLGALSDRTPGGRAPWIAGGALLAAGALAVLGAGAPGPAGLVLVWALAQLGLSATQAGLLAVVPDRVPAPQLGVVAGWAGTSQMLGALLGTVLVNGLVTDLAGGYLAMALVLLVAVVPFVLRHRTTTRPPGHAAAPASPRRGLPAPDLVRVWCGRFLVMLGFALVTQYLVYYVEDELTRADVAGSVLVLTAATVLSAVPAALLAGRWSDRTGRRRVFVAGGGATMAAGAVLLAVLPLWPVAVAAAVLTGLGFGTFLAVDLAVVATVLPSPAHLARDMGLFATAATAPQALAPVLAVPVLAGQGGYPALYLLTALVTAVGGASVLGVRTVR
ncbi:MFS transporter [Pseudonocardia tropica]|uniref:MFS transporter n=1 Tax=Pseudonocardia tropica TaxID=681289 RepID=A0ABV1JUQ0_9PSEU